MLYAPLDADRFSSIAGALLCWYAENARDLPWRESPLPYAVWISEIMAQQTRMSVLVPYYERFMKRFPTVRALASADIDEVLKLWEGLGYYSRAHNLHRAAREIVSRYGGEIPSDLDALKSLPGIGSYTAGAIMSIAFDQAVPAIDGNVLRVFSRVEANGMDVSKSSARAALFEYLMRMMPSRPGEASAFTQAAMELGALVCVPGKPDCARCPLRSYCRAFLSGDQSSYPVRLRKKPRPEQRKTVLVALNQAGAVLLRKRTENLLRGLWEFYVLDREMDLRAAREHLASVGLPCEVEPFGETSHGFTHVVWNVRGFFCRLPGNSRRAPSGCRWMPFSRLNEVAMPSVFCFFRERLMAEVGRKSPGAV